MPRQMPRFDSALATVSQEALEIVNAGELSRGSHPSEWRTHRLEALYELAYLRIFGAWELHLEGIFLRSLCGYVSRAGQETLRPGLMHYRTLATAETAMLGGRAYQLWHNPTAVIGRCQGFIRSGPGYPAAQETTISSNLANLENLAAIRHRIAHTQRDARLRFDAACVTIAGRTYRGSRPGKLLRDWDTSVVPPQRWIRSFERTLVGLMGQMV